MPFRRCNGCSSKAPAPPPSPPRRPRRRPSRRVSAPPLISAAPLYTHCFCILLCLQRLWAFHCARNGPIYPLLLAHPKTSSACKRMIQCKCRSIRTWNPAIGTHLDILLFSYLWLLNVCFRFIKTFSPWNQEYENKCAKQMFIWYFLHIRTTCNTSKVQSIILLSFLITINTKICERDFKMCFLLALNFLVNNP